MAITFVGSGAAPAFTTATPITANYPTGVQTDDILICHAVQRTDVADLSAPAGWTRKIQFDNGPSCRMAIFWKRYGAGDTDTSVDISGQSAVVKGARVHVYRGCVTAGDPFEAADPDGTNHASAKPQAMVPDSITTLTDGARIIAAAHVADDGTGATGTNYSISNSQGLTWTERDDRETTTGADESIGYFDAEKATAGAQTGPTIDMDPTASAEAQTWMGALQPEGAAPSSGVRRLSLLGVGH